jgi:hypothetical protein
MASKKKKKASRKASRAKNLSDKARSVRDRFIDELEAQCRKGLKKDMQELNKIIAGGPLARNAQSRVRAIELKLAYAAGRPPQSHKVEGGTDNKHTVIVRRDRE